MGTVNLNWNRWEIAVPLHELENQWPSLVHDLSQLIAHLKVAYPRDSLFSKIIWWTELRPAPRVN